MASNVSFFVPPDYNRLVWNLEEENLPPVDEIKQWREVRAVDSDLILKAIEGKNLMALFDTKSGQRVSPLMRLKDGEMIVDVKKVDADGMLVIEKGNNEGNNELNDDYRFVIESNGSKSKSSYFDVAKMGDLTSLVNVYTIPSDNPPEVRAKNAGVDHFALRSWDIYWGTLLEQNPKMNSQLEGIQILACQHQYEIVGTLLSRFPFGCDLLEKALAINPNDPFALANGSRCFKDEQKAQGMLEKAMSLKQNWAYPYYELGLRKFDQAKYEEAENLFKKAIEINPDSVLLHMKLADSLKGQKKYSEEIRTLKEMSHLLKSRYKDLKIKNYNSLLGFAYFHMGEYQFAERYLRKFLAQDPTEISKTQRFEALVGLGEAIYGQRFEGCDKGEVNMNMIRAAIEPFLEAQKMKEYSNRNWDCVQKYLKEIKKIERRSFWGRVKKVITFKDLRDLLSGRA